MNKTAHADAPPHPVSVRWQLWIVAVGFFMQSLDTTKVIHSLTPQNQTKTIYNNKIGNKTFLTTVNDNYYHLNVIIKIDC
ncbi:hypothetical protein JK212_16225 [Tatumella sp. JGM82]|nr:hypothetical protein [Tatumella sp. JGM82]MBS0892401.1 hypothetical protein [Tatumella sp. JGM94]